MFVLLPFVWLIIWLVIGGAVAAFSGLGAQGDGLMLFLSVFLGGCFGLPIVGGIGWWAWSRIRQHQ